MTSKRFWHALTVLALLALAGVPFAFGDGAQPADMPAAAAVGACADCHDLSGPGYTRNPHIALNRDAALASRFGVESSCAGCHGDGAAHIDSGGDVTQIFAFGEDVPATVKSDRCMTCHQDSHPRFFATAHAQAGLSCTSCHAIHGDGGPDLLTPPEGPLQVELANTIGSASASCATCHQSELSQFDFNERHRLREGILACVDCHSPHEPSPRMRLGGFKQDTCVTCHADKGGPFIFEHGAQRVEGCVSCHTPHGSPNRHMLNFQKVADQCYSCHAVVPSFHTRFTSETNCTNCHVTIHGSNFHAAFLQ